MCDCIRIIEEDEKGGGKKLIEDEEGLTLKKINLKEVIFLHRGNRLVSRTGSSLEVEVEERKRPVKVSLAHTYCPFCGERYEE